ncbi:hypothetical protein SAMN05421736_104106 [Evansella caseinilytica]|uniref:Uncharacterized protein n=1 Tax=Evansella caseinilytica TaxID=1503961 RepID=A0A1H3NLZ9_9BACI|nr:hypothetical protein [Evansella caseinilytica]SDY89229.1 hypothetical protein SAMN05421736_104106 [Evansella caseinilytica]
MSWRDQIWEQRWLEGFLPNYLKPLRDAKIETEDMKEFIREAEEFISDLASLSELPRLNKTFKRNIRGYLYKIKIKPKKLHLELLDTKKSPDQLKKRVYITTYRKQFKAEKGMGKCIDSTIYYQSDNRTIVRNVRKHHLFQRLFLLVHQLDMSLAGKKPSEAPLPEPAAEKLQPSVFDEKQHKQKALIVKVNEVIKEYGALDELILTKLNELRFAISECAENIELLDIEEKHHLNRLVNNDLPNLLETYKSLTETQRKESYEDVVGAIHSMRTFVEKQDREIKASRMDRMKQLLKLNELRYEQNVPKKRDAD